MDILNVVLSVVHFVAVAFIIFKAVRLKQENDALRSQMISLLIELASYDPDFAEFLDNASKANNKGE